MAKNNLVMEQQIMARAITSADFTNTILAINVPQLISDKKYQSIAMILVRYYSTTSEFISENSLLSKLSEWIDRENNRRSQKNTELLSDKDIMDYVATAKQLLSLEVDENSEFVDSLEVYIKDKLASSAIIEEAGKGTSHLAKRTQEAMDKINDIDISGNKNPSINITKDFEKKAYFYKHDYEGRIKSGLSTLDNALKGGLQPGEIGLICGLSGFGKTAVLTNLAAYYSLVANNNVLYLYLEGKNGDAIGRVDRLVTDTKYRDMFTNDGYVKKDFIKKNYEFYKNNPSKGNLILKKFTTRSLTISKLRTYIQSRERTDNIKFDVVVLDYADLMRVGNKADNESVSGEVLYQDLVGVADETNVLIWTGTQLNRTSSSSDVMTFDNVEGSYRKKNICSAVFTLNRNKQEDTEGYERLYIDKLRDKNGIEDDFLYFKYNKSTGRLSSESKKETDYHKGIVDTVENSYKGNHTKPEEPEYAKQSKEVDLSGVGIEPFGIK